MKGVKNSIVDDFQNIEHLTNIITDLTKDKKILRRVNEIKSITEKYGG